MNKEAIHQEIGSHLSELDVPIIGLLETRVKQINANKITKKLRKSGTTLITTHNTIMEGYS